MKQISTTMKLKIDIISRDHISVPIGLLYMRQISTIMKLKIDVISRDHISVPIGLLLKER